MNADSESHFYSASHMDKTTFCRFVKLVAGPHGDLCSSQKKSPGERILILMKFLSGYSIRTIA